MFEMIPRAAGRHSTVGRTNPPAEPRLLPQYEIPVFSATVWMLPLHTKQGRDEQFNRSNPYSTSWWHTDACCHPNQYGHLVLALVVAYCLTEEERVLLSYNEFDSSEIEHDFTTNFTALLRDPLYLSPEEDEMYVQGNMEAIADFSDPKGHDEWKDLVVANEGWEWYPDNKFRDKFGFIANGTEGGQHFAMKLVGRKHGRVDLTYVRSYENFGSAYVWLDDSIDNVYNDSFCKGTSLSAGESPQKITTEFKDKVSLPMNSLLRDRLPNGEEKLLHVCLTPRDKKQKGTMNKFKLLGITCY